MCEISELQFWRSSCITRLATDLVPEDIPQELKITHITVHTVEQFYDHTLWCMSRMCRMQLCRCNLLYMVTTAWCSKLLAWLTQLCRRGDTELHYREAYHSEADRWQVTSDQAWDLVRSMHPSWQRNNTHTRAQGRQPQLHASSQASVHSRSSHGAVSLENRANGPARWA